MNCRHKTGYCLKIYEATKQKVFVDDRGCQKCDGNPKMPKTYYSAGFPVKMQRVHIKESDPCKKGTKQRGITGG